MQSRARRRVKWLWAFAAFWLLIPSGAAAIWYFLRLPERTPAMRGAILARELGCFACHGPDGSGGVADPKVLGGTIPGWGPGVAEMYVTCREDIRQWILHGDLSREKKIPALAIAQGLVPMPAYREMVTDQELEDLVAFFEAASGFYPDMPDDAFAGWKVASWLGCFGCHGPSGMGGVQNPGSYKGHIPPWDGEEFDELVFDEAELREWILDGKIRRLWDNRAARHYLEQQIIQMPPYREHISDDELDKLVGYIRWLRDRGA